MEGPSRNGFPHASPRDVVERTRALALGDGVRNRGRQPGEHSNLIERRSLGRVGDRSIRRPGCEGFDCAFCGSERIPLLSAIHPAERTVASATATTANANMR